MFLYKVSPPPSGDAEVYQVFWGRISSFKSISKNIKLEKGKWEAILSPPPLKSRLFGRGEGARGIERCLENLGKKIKIEK